MWHGTDWIKDGGVIRAKEVAENFEYLKKRIDDLESKITSTSTSTTVNKKEIVAGCTSTRSRTIANFGWKNTSCWGGASYKKGRGNVLIPYKIIEEKCPNNTVLFSSDIVLFCIDPYFSDSTINPAYEGTGCYKLPNFVCIK